MASSDSKLSSNAAAIPIWKAPASWMRCSLYGGKEIQRANDLGSTSAHSPTPSMDTAQIRTTDLTKIRLAHPICNRGRDVP